jgi:hypothetical protein
VAAVLKTARLANRFEEAGGSGTFSDEHPTEGEFQASFECLWDSMWLPAGVVRRARLERIPGRRQRLVPIALCAIAPSGCAQFDEEICYGWIPI